jgi:amino acid adenylation domain-containing protein
LALSEELQALSREQGVTLFMTLLSGWAVLLSRYSGQPEVAVGTPVANRTRRETEGLIGFFVNMLVLRADLRGDPRVVDVLKQTREVALQAYAHQDIAFEQLVEELNPERSVSHSPLFQVSFGLANTPFEAEALPGFAVLPLRGEAAEDQEGTARFDMTLNMQESALGLVGALEYNTDLFDRETIQRVLDHYARLLEAMVTSPQSRLSQLPMLTEEERRQQLIEWNATARAYPDDRCIHELFEEQVRRRPDAVALVYEGSELTYAELNRRANRLAHQLIERGVGPEARVGLCMERSAQMVIGMLGILKAGGCYVPLDPDYPLKRIEYLLEDARIGIVVTEASVATSVSHPGRDLLLLNDADALEPSASRMLENLDSQGLGLCPAHPAYLIYTSASTGAPKGVVGLHRSIVNRVNWLAVSRAVKARDVLCQKTSVGFVDHVAEVFQALSAGVPLVIISPALLQSPRELLRTLNSRRVTQLTLVPSFLKTLLAAWEGEPARWLESIHSSGEALHLSGLENVEESFPRARVFNIYGSTEVGADVTCQEVQTASLRSQGAGSWAPIGKAIDNTQVYVLDADRRLTAQGAVGELYVGGAGLARGYFGRAGLTAEKFVPNPFCPEPGERIYRTGDLVRWQAEGRLEYLGRIDQQVKVRGFRVELGEIESVLLAHDGVRDAVVVACDEESGSKRLVGYVTAASGAADEVGLVDALRTKLRAQLPHYMVPSALVVLESLPMTPSGKVDRQALPAPEKDLAQAEYVAPRNEFERRLCELWQELLKVERVGIQDNFFELGGHSLLIIKLGTRILETTGMSVTVIDLYANPTIAAFAEGMTMGPRIGGQEDKVLMDAARQLDSPARALDLESGMGSVS